MVDPGLAGMYGFLLYAAHLLFDYVLQSPRLAGDKAGPGWAGRAACVLHVATQLGGVLAVAVLVAVVTPATWSTPRVVVALVVIGATHYFADRRRPLRRLLWMIRGGRDMEWIDGPGLAYADQSWHVWWLGVASIGLAVV